MMRKIVVITIYPKRRTTGKKRWHKMPVDRRGRKTVIPWGAMFDYISIYLKRERKEEIVIF